MIPMIAKVLPAETWDWPELSPAFTVRIRDLELGGQESR